MRNNKQTNQNGNKNAVTTIDNQSNSNSELSLTTIIYNNEPVITTEQLAQVYKSDVDNIQKNFKRNEKYFEKGIHYFFLEGAELRAFKNCPTNSRSVNKHTRNLILWTHQGATRHCKLVGTKQAWQQFDVLERNYFNKINKPNIPQEFLDQMPKNYPDALISYAEALRENEVLQEDNRLLESENIKLSSEKEQLLPRAANWETFTNTNDLYTIKEFVALADTGLGRTKMFDFMRKENFILKNVDNENLPYQQYADSGHFKTKMTRRHNGTLYQQLMISPKGMNLVLKRLHDKQMIDSEQLTEMKKLALGLQKNDSAEVSV